VLLLLLLLLLLQCPPGAILTDITMTRLPVVLWR
jgi:hypothetical protein